MRLFQSKFTTKNFQIGSPEAEAESQFRSKIKLSDVFQDYLEILPELEYEKFIITGRKGSGKTAIGEHLLDESKNKPNLFCDFIRKADLDIEKIVQLGKEQGHQIEQGLIFKWIILIKLLKLISQNEGLVNVKGIKDLKAFIKLNTGYVDIKNYEVEELIKKEGFNIKIEHFKSFLAKYGKDLKEKSGKAPFFKLLPHLEDAIFEVLNSEENKENSNKYILIFDDLDIGFKSDNKNSIEILLDLLRISKDFNNNVFGKNNLDVKIVILLRTDIACLLKRESDDSAKIFSSYEIPIIWYNHELFKEDENLLKIKQFINNRIKINFERNNIPMLYKNDPWKSFIADDPSFYVNGSFKYVLDHTFIRPRDFILFFKPLSTFQFPLPLSQQDINKLLVKFASELVDELSNELNSSLERSIIERLFKVLRSNVDSFPMSVEKFEKLLNDTEFEGINKSDFFELLFQFSIIGNKDLKSPKVCFKHREGPTENVTFNKDLEIVLPFIIKVFLKQVHENNYSY